MGYHSHSVGWVGSLWDTTHIVWVGWEVCGILLTQCGQGERSLWDTAHTVCIGWEVCGILLTQCGQGERSLWDTAHTVWAG